jgi:hypothetical protein
MSTASSWFLVIMGREQGPFSTDDMRNLVADGSIKPDTLVRRGDQETAVPAAQIRGLLPAAAAIPVEPARPTPAPARSNSVKAKAPAGTRPGTAIHVTVSPAAPATRRVGAASKTATPAPAPQPEYEESASADGHEDELSEEQVPEGRATSAQRLRSLGIDFLLIGGLAFGLIFYAWGMADRASDKRIEAIDAARKSQSEAQVSNRGEPRPSLAGWPAVETQVQERIAAKRLLVDAANAALPKIPKGSTPTHEQALQQAAAANLANELEFLVKYLEFETNAYAKETAQIATIREATSRSSNFLVGFGVILLVVIAPICELLTGGTPGKLMTGLRAVGPNRKSIGVVPCLIRHAARFVPGVHAPLFTAEDGLALHDRWSNSEVVEKSAVQRGGRKPASASRDPGKSRSSSARAGSQTGRASRSR